MLKIKVNYFNLKYTLECGQCFRWKYIEDTNSYIGVILDRVISIKQEKEYILVDSNKLDDLEPIVIKYFCLDKDYKEVEDRIANIDSNIKESLKYSSGIRILRQPLFETIISYIISANNNIKRISRSVGLISQRYGTRVIFQGGDYYLFPTLDQMKDVTIDELLSLGVGFRAKYIKNVVKCFFENRKLLDELKGMDTLAAKEKLLTLQGVGPKVADCILLFSLERSEVFPVDVWIKRIMERLYFKENVSIKEISKYAQNNFKGDAGIVQQHLFYNVREGKI